MRPALFAFTALCAASGPASAQQPPLSNGTSTRLFASRCGDELSGECLALLLHQINAYIDDGACPAGIPAASDIAPAAYAALQKRAADRFDASAVIGAVEDFLHDTYGCVVELLAGRMCNVRSQQQPSSAKATHLVHRDERR